jgi:hypothetical protein
VCLSIKQYFEVNDLTKYDADLERSTVGFIPGVAGRNENPFFSVCRTVELSRRSVARALLFCKERDTR